MSSIFAKRRARLLAMKAIRDSYVPGDQGRKSPWGSSALTRHSMAQPRIVTSS